MQACFPESTFHLPENVAACPLPDHTWTQDAAIDAARFAFGRLFPNTPFLAEPQAEPRPSAPQADTLSERTQASAPSQAEEDDPLAAALKALDAL